MRVRAPGSADALSISDGTVFLCGTARRGEGPNGVNDDWFVAALDADTGTTKWSRLEDGQAHGSNSARNIILDRGGNIRVLGVFDTGDPSQGGQGRKLES